MELVSRFIDHVIDENNKVVSGNDTLPIQKSNFLTFGKKINFLDKEVITRCPGCGYPLIYMLVENALIVEQIII